VHVDGEHFQGESVQGESVEGEGIQGENWETMGAFMREAYLRYSFTKGSEQEVHTLIEVMGLQPGDRVLDVGCGPGRHAAVFVEKGISVVGVDLSEEFIEVARQQVTSPLAEFQVADARTLNFANEFDAAVALCQGAFGSAPPAEEGDQWHIGADRHVLTNIAAALKPGGAAAVTAFNAYFQVRWLEEHDHFDAQRGLNLESTELRNPAGQRMEVGLWTTCFTPRELALLAEVSGLEPEGIYSAEPGRYGTDPPTVQRPEFLMIARRKEALAFGHPRP
jgi:SAM-dependent methyltransferase